MEELDDNPSLLSVAQSLTQKESKGLGWNYSFLSVDFCLKLLYFQVWKSFDTRWWSYKTGRKSVGFCSWCRSPSVKCWWTYVDQEYLVDWWSRQRTKETNKTTDEKAKQVWCADWKVGAKKSKQKNVLWADCQKAGKVGCSSKETSSWWGMYFSLVLSVSLESHYVFSMSIYVTITRNCS